jgi:hypothetical protein
MKGLALARDATKEDIAALIARQINVDLLHPDYLELAPDNWHEAGELTARFMFDRLDLNALIRTPYDQFKAQLDKTRPAAIKTKPAVFRIYDGKEFVPTQPNPLTSRR